MQWGSQGGGPEVLDTTIKKIVLYNRKILSNYTQKKKKNSAKFCFWFDSICFCLIEQQVCRKE